MDQDRNIILISIDDGNAFWRYRNDFGHELLTPNLNRIFDASTAFTSAYCQVPICGPSRASMLTGLSPCETGIFDNYTRLYHVVRPDHLWQFRLRKKGYYCSTAGKIHHAFSPQPPELHDVLYSHKPRALNIAPPRRREVPTKKFGGLGGGAATTDPSHDRLYYDSQSADDAISFIQGYEGDAPFYREIGFLHPHLPYKTPLRFKEMYDENAFVQPEDWKKGFDLAAFPQEFIEENFASEDLDEWRKSVRNYFSCYSHMDYHLGRVWDALMASPHAENTVVVIYSDHGYHLGDKRRFRKSTLYEECTRVPLMIYDPANPGGVVEDPVGLIDIGPTILDYSGCQPLFRTHGRSLRGAVESKRGDPDRAIPSFQFGAIGIRSGPWRLNLYPDGGSEFHDVEEDKWLSHNLAHDHPDYRDTFDRLTTVAVEWGFDLGSTGKRTRRALSVSMTTDAGSAQQAGTSQVFVTGTARTQAKAGCPVECTELLSPLSSGSRFEMSPATRTVKWGIDGGGKIDKISIFGNLWDNDISLIYGHSRFGLDIYTGPGNNTILASHDRVSVRCGDGNNTVTAAAGGVVHGGAGSDHLTGGRGETRLHGGPGGKNTLRAGDGDATIFSGHGQSTIQSGTGNTHIVVEGGANTIDARPGSSRLTLRRTGLPQVITCGETDLLIDLTDWAEIGPVTLAECQDGVRMECGTEQALVVGVPGDRLSAAIVGAQIIYAG
ncbi:sulfatase-like hydrolase/transferase [Alphaproteobacteria bacterium GH1-50]|uniref:Sulfatase-like hydrolase/transferase n=1 Tax=Kangsaoukella pontilimi TaxID=2691042 RepID=A0A7C9IPM7_9RHOB|nr:sulfatase-like hydrolase/transferase [Kangsaoukella pontilimi]MXQ08210.1 sulfatase-like hydrolase/transferase [Kangsaoukella pontilimi]